MTFNHVDSKLLLQAGFAPILILLLILLLIGGAIAFDFGYVYILEHCQEKTLTDCFAKSGEPQSSDTDKDPGEGILATGALTKGKYGVTMSLSIPNDGGEVTGTFEGDCNGTISGTFSGGDGGTINGKAYGSCSPFWVPVPASAEFSGTLNQATRSVPITGSGTAAGFSGEGSLTLQY